jgi:hypothetical protein
MFRFVGRVIGKALFDGMICNAHFTPPVYKALLGVQVGTCSALVTHTLVKHAHCGGASLTWEMIVSLSLLLLLVLCQVCIRDMEFVDKAMWSSMEWMMENDISGVIFEYFTVTTDVLGSKETVELKPGGAAIEVRSGAARCSAAEVAPFTRTPCVGMLVRLHAQVTESNKHEYLVLLSRWRLVTGIKEQMDEMMKVCAWWSCWPSCMPCVSYHRVH